MYFYVGTLFRIKIFVKIFILFQAMCATLGNLVTIKYFITYGIVYTIMLVSLPYCLVKVKN